jgi:hypothetical protein
VTAAPGANRSRQSQRRLIGDVVLIVGKLDQHVCRVAATGAGKSDAIVSVAALAGQLDKLVNSVPAAGIRETTQFLRATSLTRQLDELIHRVSILLRGLVTGRIAAVHPSLPYQAA